MDTQRAKQKTFLAYAFGCPMNYTGKSMREAHAHMDLTEDHFNAVAGHLVATLNELQVPQDLIDQVVTIAVSTKDDVLERVKEIRFQPIKPNKNPLLLFVNEKVVEV